MAIFGNFSDMPLPEVLSLLGRGSGQFVIVNHPSGSPIELHIHNGIMMAMHVAGRMLDDVLAVRGHILTLIKVPEGEFEFRKAPLEELDQQIQVPLDQLFLSCLSSLDEIEAYQEHFPNAYTFFELVENKETVWLDGELEDFVERNREGLSIGISSHLISQQTQMNLDQVRLYFFKLRSAGVLKPVRKAEAVKRHPSAQVIRPANIGSDQASQGGPIHGQDLTQVQVAGKSNGNFLKKVTNFLQSCFRQ